jgi:hypothetical protein
MGLTCLRESVAHVKRLYPECDLLICHNQIGTDQLQSLNVPLFDQSKSVCPLGISPQEGYQVHWKLYPPRLRPDAHEIIMDNDIVLVKRPAEIDAFLSGDATLMCHGLNGLHGKFDKYVPKGVRVNSGIFGMPPGFDFNKTAKAKIPEHDLKCWERRFDEQGLVAATLTQYHKRIFISVTVLPIVEKTFDIDALTTDACCGYHFAGLNYNNDHLPWITFKTKLFKMA